MHLLPVGPGRLGGVRRPRCPAPPVTASDREQAIEERPVVAESHPQVLGRDVLAVLPLFFEVRALVGERLGELLHDLRDQTVGLLDRARGLVDEAGLNVLPPGPEGLGCIGRKERRGTLLLGLGWPGGLVRGCLLYTSDAADDLTRVDLG